MKKIIFVLFFCVFMFGITSCGPVLYAVHSQKIARETAALEEEMRQVIEKYESEDDSSPFQ